MTQLSSSLIRRREHCEAERPTFSGSSELVRRPSASSAARSLRSNWSSASISCELGISYMIRACVCGNQFIIHASLAHFSLFLYGRIREDAKMGPFPHDAPPAKISAENPAGTDGFEFVEFAHAEPNLLKILFEQMGFEFVAHHKSRAIDLYRQGGVSYILNADRSSFGGRFVDTHGPCAPAMAWRVAAGPHTMATARERGCPRATS